VFIVIRPRWDNDSAQHNRGESKKDERCLKRLRQEAKEEGDYCAPDESKVLDVLRQALALKVNFAFHQILYVVHREAR